MVEQIQRVNQSKIYWHRLNCQLDEVTANECATGLFNRSRDVANRPDPIYVWGSNCPAMTKLGRFLYCKAYSHQGYWEQ
jgi:hypothetical protein